MKINPLSFERGWEVSCPFSVLLIDLDGTVIDPARGILDSCRYALGQLKVDQPPDSVLLRFIGPPLRSSFSEFLAGRGDPVAALDHYRRHYAERGLYQADIYAGMVKNLKRLRNAGARLVICTSKPKPFADRILQSFNLASLFAAIYGADLDGTFEDKGDLIRHILAFEGFRPADCCMIGDREHDVFAANQNAIPTVGVLWGYGSEQELNAAGVSALCRAPDDLAAAIREAQALLKLKRLVSRYDHRPT